MSRVDKFAYASAWAEVAYSRGTGVGIFGFYYLFFLHGPYVDDLGWTLDSTITKPSQKIGNTRGVLDVVNAVSGTLN